jgi:3-methyladenine DNA glycosylase AlkC
MPALKENVNGELLRSLAVLLAGAWPDFPTESFLADASDSLGNLELKDRIRHVAAALGRALPADPARVVAILDEALAAPELKGWMAWPCAELLGTLVSGAPDMVIPFMARLTPRASCEFAIRPCIENHPELTFAYLEEWAGHADEHVRRLVSEGTRPRLPWGARLRALQADPSPSLRLLDRLREDPSDYVRRSVANHLGDIAKDHPALALETAARWRAEGGQHVDEVVRHGLRALVKAGDPEALALIGYDHRITARLVRVAVDPQRLAVGGQATISVTLMVDGDDTVPVVVEYRVHFLGVRGRRKPRAFRMARLMLEPGVPTHLSRRHTFDHVSIRTLHPGDHLIDIQVNGRVLGSCVLELVDA